MLSEIASELVNKFDEENKGCLNIKEFEKMAKQNFEQNVSKEEVLRFLEVKENEENTRTVDKL